MKNKFLLLMMLISMCSPVMAQENIEEELELLEEISVTATRTERKIKEVSSSVAIIGPEDLKDTVNHNIKDSMTLIPGVQIQSKNGGYDTRLAIRGAGLKAAYGVREIMILVNGVPITDPDSFTRLDMIDPQNIERIEVVKGPNSTLWGANAAGGVINIITKNPLKDKGVKVRMGTGSYGMSSLNVNLAESYSKKFYYNLALSTRKTDNDWRRWNKFSSNQFSFQPTYVLEGGDLLESRLAYSEANIQLPGSLSEAMWDEFKNSGKAAETDGAWQFSGRYSTNILFSSKLKTKLAGQEFIPMIYANQWTHHHPVYGKINDALGENIGTDIQLNNKHENGTLTYGISLRAEETKSDYYQYKDLQINQFSSRLEAVLSDNVGVKMGDATRKTQLYGIYAQESYKATENLLIDFGVRYDQINFDITGRTDSFYDAGTASYKNCLISDTVCKGVAVVNKQYKIGKKYDSFAPRVGTNYKWNEDWNLYGNVSQGIQTPTQGELMSNPELKIVSSINYEIGMKGGNKDWVLETSVYHNILTDEVVKTADEFGQTVYLNAGKTQKQGFELGGHFKITEPLTFGYSYTAMNFTFLEFEEPVRILGVNTPVSRAGNRLAYSPDTQHGFFLKYKKEEGFKAKLSADSWGSYMVDNENTELYEGYKNVAKLMIGYETKNLDLKLNIDNLFDQRYAVEVKKAYGKKTYSPAAPRVVALTGMYKF